jgi:hypothetical protein
MEANKRSRIFGAVALCLGLSIVIVGIIYIETPQSAGPIYLSNQAANVGVAKPRTKHILTPDPVRAIYMTSYVADVPEWRERIAKLIDDTELNALVLDIKDYTGVLIVERAPDIKEYIQDLHDRNIYVIGRLSVFQDQRYVKEHPELAVKRKDNGGVWHDRKGIAWIDAGSHEAWDYIVGIAKDYYEMGFDEINFDYIRFPSDGDMSNVLYTHAGTSTRVIVMSNFYKYLNTNVRALGIPTSADFFGMTTVNKDDLGIGQLLESALPHFDFIAPMVYPSHYPPQFIGYANPNKVPYEIVNYSMVKAVERAIAASSSPAKLRPWLQDFDYGGDYGEAEVRAQKNAVYDAGLNSWMMWDAGVKYTPEAFDKVSSSTIQR